MRTRIKFCGCRSVNDVMLAVECGADAVGMIFAESKRRVSVEDAREIAAALPAFITPVGVFVNPTPEEIAAAREIFPDLVVQLHGDEPASFVSSVDGKVIKALHVPPEGLEEAELDRLASAHPRALLLFDTVVGGQSGGTGVAFNWRHLTPLARGRQILVAGGLTPENVSSCVRTVRPFGVDVCSGIETGGKKDPLKMRAFVQAVKDTDVA